MLSSAYLKKSVLNQREDRQVSFHDRAGTKKNQVFGNSANARTLYKKLQGQKYRLEDVDSYYLAMLLARSLVLHIFA